MLEYWLIEALLIEMPEHMHIREAAPAAWNLGWWRCCTNIITCFLNKKNCVMEE